jgi:hypothetical protein
LIQRLYGGDLRAAAERLYGGDLPTVEAPVVRPKRSGSTDYARRLWTSAVPIEGTPAELYLRRRFIGLILPETLRFARIPAPKESGLSDATGTGNLPVMLALVQAYDGSPIGVQRTYLTEDGGKASATDGKVKYSLGTIRGGAVRLGPVERTDLVLCEGIEDALSLMEMGAPSAWAAAGSSMLDGMVLPEGVRSVVIAGDADEAGRIAAERAAASFHKGGREVRLIYPAAGFKDFNEELAASAQQERAA